MLAFIIWFDIILIYTRIFTATIENKLQYKRINHITVKVKLKIIIKKLFVAKIYISSTYQDLKDYREVVYKALRKNRHDVISMEDYVSENQKPLQKCLDDVASCDVYVGIFAWRYGYIPKDEKVNPDNLSITELEYRKAKEVKIPCLIFLLDEDKEWPLSFVDGLPKSGIKSIENIIRLRNYLNEEYLLSLFLNKDELATNVLAAVNQPIKEKKSKSEPETAGYILRDKNVMNQSKKFMNHVKGNMDICFEKNASYFVVDDNYPYIEGYRKIRKNKGKIRVITEITKSNIKQCKKLQKMVSELRHLNRIEGGISVSDNQYMTATIALLEKIMSDKEKVKMSNAIFSDKEEAVIQNQSIFNTLWENAIPADVQFRKLSNNIKIKTRQIS